MRFIDFKDHRPKGFTLIELILVMGLFALMTTLLFTALTSVYHFKEILQAKKEVNAQGVVILNNSLASLIRSGFAINYDQTKSGPPQDDVQLGEVLENVDQLSIYTDQAETQYFTLYRKPYQAEGEDFDTAPLYLKWSTGEEVPLHSSEIVVEDFDVEVPKDPRLEGDSDLQPYVTLNFKVRHRHGFEGEDKEEIRTSYKTTFTLRNATAASNKNPVSEASVFKPLISH